MDTSDDGSQKAAGSGGFHNLAAGVLGRVMYRMPWFRTLCFALSTALLGAGCTDLAPVPGSATTVAGAVVQGIQPGTKTCTTPANNDAMVARVLELVNQERTQRGLDPLTLNPKLSKMAEDYACEMISQTFFDHVDPQGKGPGPRALEHGYMFLAIGENLAGGQSTAEQVMAEWMASTEGHRENILAAQWREIGIGVRTGGQFGVYWVQEFGNPP